MFSFDLDAKNIRDNEGVKKYYSLLLFPFVKIRARKELELRTQYSSLVVLVYLRDTWFAAKQRKGLVKCSGLLGH